MRELGYVEGQNVTYEARFADGRIDRLPALAAQFVKMKVDVIVTGGTMAAQATKRATTSIPIVMATGSDQVGLGIVAGLARPGGNVTGVTSFTAELNGKRLSLLKEAVPKLSRTAFLLVEGDASSGMGLRDAQAAAGALDMFVSVFGVNLCRRFWARRSCHARISAAHSVLRGRDVEFGLVGSYLARQLGALTLKGLALVKRPRHAGLLTRCSLPHPRRRRAGWGGALFLFPLIDRRKRTTKLTRKHRLKDGHWRW
jgi:hypothetical protein